VSSYRDAVTAAGHCGSKSLQMRNLHPIISV
jgi:hypothetical protein